MIKICAEDLARVLARFLREKIIEAELYGGTGKSTPTHYISKKGNKLHKYSNFD